MILFGDNLIGREKVLHSATGFFFMTAKVRVQSHIFSLKHAHIKIRRMQKACKFDLDVLYMRRSWYIRLSNVLKGK